MRTIRQAAAAFAFAVAVAACSGGDEGSAEDLCAALRAEPGVASAFAGFDPTDTDDALERLRAARVTLGALRDSAPAEVRDELSVEIDYVQALVEGLEGVDPGDATEAVAVVQRVTEEHPEVEPAATRLGQFADASCA